MQKTSRSYILYHNMYNLNGVHFHDKYALPYEDFEETRDWVSSFGCYTSKQTVAAETLHNRVFIICGIRIIGQKKASYFLSEALNVEDVEFNDDGANFGGTAYILKEPIHLNDNPEMLEKIKRATANFVGLQRIRDPEILRFLNSQNFILPSQIEISVDDYIKSFEEKFNIEKRYY